MFKIASLIPTHNRLRNIETFKYFGKRFLQDGNDWKRDDIITVVKTEDERYYLWNGHHQVCAAYYTFKRYIPDECYKIVNMSYETVNTVNFDLGFVTPFDMRFDCRLPDFSQFKNQMISVYGYIANKNKSIIKNYIMNAGHRYKETRLVHNIKDLLGET